MDQLVNYSAKETAKIISEVNLKVLSRPLMEKVAQFMTVYDAEKVEDEFIKEEVYKRLAIHLAYSGNNKIE